MEAQGLKKIFSSSRNDSLCRDISSFLLDYLVIQGKKKSGQKAQKKCQLLIGNVQMEMILHKTN